MSHEAKHGAAIADPRANKALANAVGERYDQLTNFASRINEAHDAKPCRFRGSDLPFCGMKFLLDKYRNTPRVDSVTYMSNFYTESGHVFHANMQKWLGAAGIAFGKWECKTCKRKYPEDPAPHAGLLGPVVCCGTFAEYVEFEFLHECGFSGHMDMLLYMNGKYLVTELKQMGATWYASRTGKAGADPHHIHQVQTYRGVVSDALQIPEKRIHKSVLLWYFDRGNPKTNTRFVFDYEPSIFVTEARNFKETNKAIESGRYNDVCRRCRSKTDDPFCPYNSSVCFNEDVDYRYRILTLILPKEVARCLA